MSGIHGEKILKNLLGKSYKKTINALRNEEFSNEELDVFAQKLSLEKFYKELQKSTAIEKKRFPEELLRKWAADNEDTASKSVLSYLFRGADVSGKFHKIQAENFHLYLTLPTLPSLPDNNLFCCTKPSTLSPLSPAPHHEEATCVQEQTHKRKTLLLHSNLDAVSAEKMLEKCDEGTYLLRNSSDNKSLAISVKWKSCIEHYKEENFDQLHQLVDNYKDKFITLLPPDVVNVCQKI